MVGFVVFLWSWPDAYAALIVQPTHERMLLCCFSMDVTVRGI